MNQTFIKSVLQNKKSLALLIDPDKYTKDSLTELVKLTSNNQPDFIFVGGSLLFADVGKTIQLIKEHTTIPVYIFPGNQLQISNNADGILFLSLISGRNPEFLIGNHILAAPKLKASNLDVVPTGYMLIDCGSQTSVSYMSNTTPIPYNKTDIAIATAQAGELLGLQSIYLEAGSGARKTVSAEMVDAVKKQINIPLIIGGGIKTAQEFELILQAGADLVVIGNSIESAPEKLKEFTNIISKYQ